MESLAETIDKKAMLKGRRVLLVDDNPDVLWVLNDMLTRNLEVEITTAVDGEGAVAIAQDEIPDLILMDLMMPGLNGIEATKRLKNDTRTGHIPIVALTAFVNTYRRNEVMKNGFVDYLEKPVVIDELVDIIFRNIV